MENASPPEMRTKLRNILGSFLFSGEDVDKKVSVLSGGERARLALACLLLKPFNLLVLDEPTNHLDIISKEVLKKALIEYDGTLIVVSHDRDFLEDLTSTTIEFRDKQLYTHIGDVNAFLKKRKMDNMREVELQKSKTASAKESAKAAAPKVLSKEEKEAQKKLQRSVQYAERKIEKLEEQIAKFEEKMGVAGFYESADSSTVMDAYNQAKKDLDAAMEEWEGLTLELEEYEL